MYVYQIINSLNNKSYIGITNNIKTRFEYHRTRYNKTNKGEFIEKPLYKAFRKYGIENFKGENIKTVYESYSNRITFSGFQDIYLGRNWKHLGGVIKNILPNGASISKDTVLNIRKMYEEDKKNPHQIAKELGLEYKKCLRICKRETYKNI